MVSLSLDSLKQEYIFIKSALVSQQCEQNIKALVGNALTGVTSALGGILNHSSVSQLCSVSSRETDQRRNSCDVHYINCTQREDVLTKSCFIAHIKQPSFHKNKTQRTAEKSKAWNAITRITQEKDRRQCCALQKEGTIKCPHFEKLSLVCWSQTFSVLTWGSPIHTQSFLLLYEPENCEVSSSLNQNKP